MSKDEHEHSFSETESKAWKIFCVTSCLTPLPSLNVYFGPD